jgi:hypothetical protein
MRMAVVASILTAICHMLKDGTMYHDLGCDHFKRRFPHQQKSARTSAYPSSARPSPGLFTDRYAAASSPDNMDKLCCG